MAHGYWRATGLLCHGTGREEKSVVYPPCLVVDNRKLGKHLGVFYRTERDTEDGHVSWKQFFKAAVQAGMASTVTDRRDAAIKPEQAAALSAWWSARQPKSE
jgi:UDP-N-acetylmuramyl pentapeptide synthase